jgi:uncharacterized membrane protein
VRSDSDRRDGTDTMRRMRHASRAISLSLVIACVLGTMALGIATKAPCATGHYSDGRQYRWLCYTDVVPLLATEQLAHGRLPFIDECAPSENNCDEYPVVTMYLMRVAAWVGDSYRSFYYTNAAIMTLFAAVAAVCVWLLGGRRALWFALAPTLLIYGTVNWDLAAVAAATAALVAWTYRREGWAGVFIGIGASAKFYPAFLIVPLFLQGLQELEPDRSVRMLWWAVGSWVAINLPFALIAPGGWWEFFRFNSARTPDFDSAWYIACRHVPDACVSINAVNVLALGLFLLASFAAVWWKLRRHPSFPRWTIGLPLLICFLVSNKVYSPQYSLWLLPWFALTLPSLRRLVAFEVADVVVFVTRFWFFGTHDHVMVLPQQWWFEVALGLRAAVLIWCLVGWVRDEMPPLPDLRRLKPAVLPALAA